jgi:hypothetical protein
MGAIYSFETSVLTRATRRNIPKGHSTTKVLLQCYHDLPDIIKVDIRSIGFESLDRTELARNRERYVGFCEHCDEHFSVNFGGVCHERPSFCAVRLLPQSLHSWLS